MSGTTIAIVGGGYIGAAAAIHLSRVSRQALNIVIIDPSAVLGGGVAFSAKDPDHRLNAPTRVHFLYPGNTESFTEWHGSSGAQAADPESVAADGRVFARRADFGAYVSSELDIHRAENPSHSTITHISNMATSLAKQGAGWRLTLSSGAPLGASVVLVTPCNLAPAVPSPFRELSAHPAVYTNPWDLAQLSEIPADAKLLIVGTGLTMADLAVTLLRDGPGRRITAVSRRGLYPLAQRSHPPSETVWEALIRPVPAFVERHGVPKSALAVLRAHRADIAQLAAEGIEWQVAFDELRDAAHRLWPSLPAAEQQRYFRHLSPWYETHRFRLPPQTGAKLDNYRQDGRLKYRAGFLTHASDEDGRLRVGFRARGQNLETETLYDAVINCTGPERDPARAGNLLLAQMIGDDIAAASPFGMGLEVDQECRSLSADGAVMENLHIIGPMTRSRFGEINGIPTIAQQVHRVAGEITARLEP
ncbi:MAG: NAD(P)-binding protein [Rhodospirillaceae bacterium]|nr:NAD(P)-binding protein [Rhodospirillaceae bacterium]MBT4720005.1 NAD(P)-binding protein [Rhodospirillaceae bacterium]MBT6859037.1 NAD(P)-binding protein [Rhodospirillaceae bacterium]MBT7030894.1 NAD(P)-binding protein [Rhodospirillaceae bacterium]